MKKRIFLPALFLLTIVSVCLAANVDGKWIGIVAGQYEFNMNVKAEGEVLTGVAFVTGTPEIKITDGVIKGDDMSFKINSPQYGEITCQAKLNGDKMTLSMNVGGNILDTEMARAK